MYYDIDRIKSSDNVYAGMAIALVIALVIGYFVGGPSKIHLGAKAWRWKTTEAVVTGTKSYPDKQVLNLRVDFTYKVNGRDYNGSRIFSGHSYDDIPWLQSYFPAGKKVECLYNPKRPDKVMLEYEYRMFDFFVFMSIGVFVIVICTGAVLVMIIHLRSKPENINSLWALSFHYAKISLGILLFIFGLICFYYAGVRSFIKAAQQHKRVKVDAVIETSRIIRENDKFGAWKTLDFSYTYEFNGSKYRSKQFSTWNDDDMFYITGKYSQGMKTMCYVMPDTPEDAVLKNYIPWGIIGGLVPLLVALGGGLIVYNAISEHRLKKQFMEMEMDGHVDDELEDEYGPDDDLEEDDYEDDEVYELSEEELRQLQRNPFKFQTYRSKILTDIQLILLSGALGAGMLYFKDIRTQSDFIDPVIIISFIGLIAGLFCLFKHIFKNRPEV